MRPPKTKRVYPKDIKPGDEFEGYVSGTSHHFCIVNVQEDGTPLTFNQFPIEEKVDYFEQRLTYEEEIEWYKNFIDMTNPANQLNLMGIHTDMYGIGDAFHEMWNGWVCAEWREQLTELIDEDFFIVGIAPAPYGCFAIDDPVAVVAEYKDTGTRFWCHASQSWINTMREESKTEYKMLMEDNHGNV